MDSAEAARFAEKSISGPAEKYSVFTLFEPRWHGFARWRRELRIVRPETPSVAIVWRLEEGWTRRSRGAQYEQWDQKVEDTG